MVPAPRRRRQRMVAGGSCRRCRRATRRRPPPRMRPSTGSRCQPFSAALPELRPALRPALQLALRPALRRAGSPPGASRQVAKPQVAKPQVARPCRPDVWRCTPAGWCCARAAPGRRGISASGGSAWPGWSSPRSFPWWRASALPSWKRCRGISTSGPAWRTPTWTTSACGSTPH